MKSRKINIEELSELLELGTWVSGYKGYVITEEFEDKDKRVFRVVDLHIEIEQDYVMFFDSDDVLMNSILMAQLKESILGVCHNFVGNCLHEDVMFKTGHVYIDAIAA